MIILMWSDKEKVIIIGIFIFEPSETEQEGIVSLQLCSSTCMNINVCNNCFCFSWREPACVLLCFWYRHHCALSIWMCKYMWGRIIIHDMQEAGSLPGGASHIAVELRELMGLRDLDSPKHKKQMHTMGHYESDEPISSPLWLLKEIIALFRVNECICGWVPFMLMYCCNCIHLTDDGLTRAYI